MGLLTRSLRELLGSHVLCEVGEFVELEAAVAATTIVRHLSTIADAAGDPVMPFPGAIVAITAASEAGSNFTLQVTKNGTPDTAETLTVNSAKVKLVLAKANRVEFVAGDTVGVKCAADTTSKDVTASLWVIFNITGE